MIPQRTGLMFSAIRFARRSANIMVKTVTLLRFKQFNPPSDPRSDPARVDQEFTMTGRFYEVTAQDILDSNGYYVAGDVLSDTEREIVGVSTVQGATAQADRIEFEGFLYQAVGKPERVQGPGGRLYTKAHWRKIG